MSAVGRKQALGLCPIWVESRHSAREAKLVVQAAVLRLISDKIGFRIRDPCTAFNFQGVSGPEERVAGEHLPQLCA